MAKAKRVQFTVRGTGLFPWDMMRYDAAYPTMRGVAALNHQDSLRRGVGARSAETIEELRKPYEVELVASYGDPTPERWLSFGWRITEQHPTGY